MQREGAAAREAYQPSPTKTLQSLPLAVLLHELRTAERLQAAVGDLPREEADVHRFGLAVVREQRLHELDRRAQLFELVRRHPERQG